MSNPIHRLDNTNKIKVNIENPDEKENDKKIKSKKEIILEENKVYKLGKKTFWIFFFKYGKWFTIFGLILFYIIYLMYYGFLKNPVDNYLAKEFYGYLNKNLIAFWIFLLSIFIIFIGYLRSYMMYRQYKFILSKDAFRVRRGIFSIKELVIAYHQIQDVEIHRPYHYRILGLAKLDISLQNNEKLANHLKNNQTLIPILDKKLAEKLANELVARGSRFKE